MSDAVLVLNLGSSSMKFGLFELSSTEPRMLCKGLLDEHSARPGFSVVDPAGKALCEERRPAADTNAHVIDILDWTNDYLSGGVLLAVGHRVVHGGSDFVGPIEVTDESIGHMEALAPLAPLHQSQCLFAELDILLKPPLSAVTRNLMLDHQYQQLQGFFV